MWVVGPPEMKVFKYCLQRIQAYPSLCPGSKAGAQPRALGCRACGDTQSSSAHKKRPAFGQNQGWQAPDPAGRALSDLNVGPKPRTGICLFDLYHGSKTAPLCQGDPLAQVG